MRSCIMSHTPENTKNGNAKSVKHPPFEGIYFLLKNGWIFPLPCSFSMLFGLDPYCQAQAAWLRDSAKLSEEIHEVPGNGRWETG